MLSSTLHQRYETWQLHELLMLHPDLRVVPDDHRLVLRGILHFRVVGPKGVYLEDSYRLEIAVYTGFPALIPLVRECDGRIPKDYHKLTGDYLCVGAPTEIRLKLRFAPSLIRYVEDFLIPYLYGYSHFEKFGEMPFGELDHENGIREYLADLFNSQRIDHAEEFVRCAALKKRRANKLLCPCGSGRRLGRCHNRIVNSMRVRFGRKWFQVEYARLLISLDRNPRINAVEQWLERVPLSLQTIGVSQTDSLLPGQSAELPDIGKDAHVLCG